MDYSFLISVTAYKLEVAPDPPSWRRYPFLSRQWTEILAAQKLLIAWAYRMKSVPRRRR